MTDDREQIRATIERFIARRFAKDPAVVDEFEPDAIVVGSAVGQLHYGLPEIDEHFSKAMKKSYTLRHAWEQLDIRRNDGTAWFVAHGHAMIGIEGVEMPVPMRVSGVLVQRGEAWRYQMLHLSEPVKE